MKRALALIPAILSALLLYASFAPARESVALVCALAPLLATARLVAPKRSFQAWFVGGFIFWFMTLNWMRAIVPNGGPLPLVLLGWLGLSLLCASYFAFFGGLISFLWSRAPQKGLVYRLVLITLGEPLAWALFEYLRGVLWTGFAWNPLAVALTSSPALLQPLQLGGAPLMGALIVLINGVFATLLVRVIQTMKRQGVEMSRLVRTLETALPLTLVLGVFFLSKYVAKEPTETVPVRVVLVQRNAPCVFSARARLENPFEQFMRLQENARAFGADVVIWSESAMSEFARNLDSSRACEVARVVSEHAGGAALIAGGDSSQLCAGGQRRCFNSAALYAPPSEDVQLYSKQHLVPFGEYIPWDKVFPCLQKFSPIGVSLWPGTSCVWRVPLRENEIDSRPSKVLWAPLICFEDTISRLARTAAQKGAQALVLITNDSWFAFSSEAQQHAEHAILRAIETGLPVLRVGNSGVTGLVRASGRTQWLKKDAHTPLVDAAGSMCETVFVPRHPSLTWYTRLGDAPGLILSCLVLAVLVFSACRNSHDRPFLHLTNRA